MLAGLAAAVRAGESRVLVVRGEPGVGKTALLDYLAASAAGCRVVRAAGVQSEMELAFAGLHQLLAPMLDHLEQLPVPQQEALRTAFGISAGPVPDRQNGRRYTGRWRRRPIRRLIRIGGPGTGRRLRPGRMKRSRSSWSGPRAGRRPAAGWPRPRRSWSVRYS